MKQGKTTSDLEEAVFQQTLDEIDRGEKPCPPGDRAWFEGCLGTDKVQSCLAAIQKSEIMKALSDSKLIDKVIILDFKSLQQNYITALIQCCLFIAFCILCSGDLQVITCCS